MYRLYTHTQPRLENAVNHYDALFDAKPRCLWEDEYLLDHLRIFASYKHVLDIASGTGRLVSQVFGSQYVALDRDPEMLKLNPAKTQICGDYAKLDSLRSYGYDLVTFFWGGLKDQAQFEYVLGQAHRLLKPKARFFGVFLTKGRMDSFIYPELYDWGLEPISLDNAFKVAIQSGFAIHRLRGLTCSMYDLVEKFLTPDQLDRFIRWYMKKSWGKSNVKYLRWHYTMLEAVKP